MPRNITVTFNDGSQVVYQNAPDNITPDQVAQRASQEAQGKQVVSIDGGKSAPQQHQQDPGFLENLKNATINTVAGLGQGIAAIPDAVTNAIGAGSGYLVQGGGHLLGSIVGGQTGANIAKTADNYGNALQHPVTFGGMIENAAPTPSSTSGQVARVGAQLLGGFTPAAGVDAVGGALARTVGIDSTMANAPKIVAPGASPVPLTLGGRVANAFTPGTDNRGAQLVGQKLAEDNITPSEAASQMTAAQANGQPLMLVDMGDNTRALGADVARQPGAARDIGLNAVRDRQIGDNPFGVNTVPSQSERVQQAIVRDLGPITDPIAESERLNQQARSAASPLYEQAYNNDGASQFQNSISDLLERPSMQKALTNARSLAAEEGRNPDSLGLVLGEDGLLTKISKPTWQTFDYVKRGLDDVVESYRDPVTGKLNLDTQGRAVNNTLRSFLAKMDEANPDYAAARQAYAGPASMRDALQAGSDALNWAPNQIRAKIGDMTQPEKDQFWLGMRSALSQKAAATNDGVNVVRNLVGSGAKRDALALAAGGRANIENFMQALEREMTMNTSYAKVTGGSPTFGNALEHASNNADLAGTAINHFGNGGSVKGFGLKLGLDKVRGAIRYGVGETGKRTREDAAALLFSSNPNDFANALGQINVSNAQANALGQRIGSGFGQAAMRQASVNQSKTTGIQAGTHNY